jgi:hypothetical protein
VKARNRESGKGDGAATKAPAGGVFTTRRKDTEGKRRKAIGQEKGGRRVTQDQDFTPRRRAAKKKNTPALRG